jgi:GH18 family chitinase
MFNQPNTRKTPSVFCTVFVLFFSITMLKAQPCREIVGYYPAWKWYARNQFVNPKSIKYDRYSVINYAFFKPKADGSIEGTDAWADENLLQGEIDWTTTPKSYKPNTSLVDLAHQSGVKVVISIGGWTESDHFPAIAADTKKREKFIAECIRLITFYNLDGVDIDWEYPGFAEHKGTPNDKANCTLLFTGIRRAMDILAQKTSKQYLLTGAFGASQSNMANIEWDNIAPVMDAINMMTYDFYGAWNTTTGHNAPLYPSVGADKNACVDAAITTMIDTYKVSPLKINLGLPFYGHALKTQGEAALNALITKQKDTKLFPEGSSFHHIMAEKHRFTEYWDTAARVPYLVGNDGLNTFISYDNALSITEKTQYAIDKNLRGVLIWEITEDHLETVEGIAETPLINAVNLVLCAKSGAESQPNTLNINILDIEKNTSSPVDTIATPPQYLSDNLTTDIEKNNSTTIQNDIKTSNPEVATETTKALVASIDIVIDPTDFMIVKYELKQQGRVCLKMQQQNGTMTQDIDLGEKGVGYNEVLTALHRDLPKGVYKIWVDACSDAFNPTVFKEWVKN